MSTILKTTLAVGVLVLVLVIIGVFEPSEQVPRIVEMDSDSVQSNVPQFLQTSFPNTDFSDADPRLEKVLSGGPPKDGIPAIDDPTFIDIADFERSDAIQAVVLEAGDEIKVYPYHILNWHEIVNDTVADVPVAITFCPLCGSAIVFDRRTEAGASTFGVSGALIESNMVMYDRGTESLWQQSTGEALAGELRGAQLKLFPFQLATMGEIRER